MALWKDSNATATPAAGPMPAHGAGPAIPLKDTFARETERPHVAPVSTEAPPVRARVEMKESIISAELTIEGKIEGAGHIRIAGRFKGDVNVDGNLTIDRGAQVTGQVRASVVIVGGELNGNIDNAKRVELLDTGVISGDVKAGSLTVAAGSRMRGQVEFGWEGSAKPAAEVKGFGSGK